MRAGGGRSKGNSFERAVAKMIVTAFSRFGITAKDCYRTPSSGGHKYAKQEDPGDLVISKKLEKLGFIWHVECKHWNRIELWPLLQGDKGRKFDMWLKQVTSASNKTKREPMIVFKGNGRMPVMAMLPGTPFLNSKPVPRIVVSYKNRIWYVMTFEKLLNVMEKKRDGW